MAAGLTFRRGRLGWGVPAGGGGCRVGQQPREPSISAAIATLSPLSAEGWYLLPILLVVGFCAGLVDSIAGGGGLLTVPALRLLGVPPLLSLGTNKLQASFGSFTSAYSYTRGGSVKLSDCVVGIAMTFLGAVTGTLVVQRISNEVLAYVIPAAMMALLVYALVSPKFGLEDAQPRLQPGVFYVVFGLLLGFYDGFFGPGTGSFWTAAFLYFLGQDLRKAVGHTKVMNFTSNVAALVFFAWGGHVDVVLALPMGLGQAVGARLGARLVLRRGARFVRPIFLAVVFLTTVKLIWDLAVVG